MCWDDLLTLFAIVGQFPYTAPSTNTSGMVGNGRGRQGGRREEEIEDDDEPTDSSELVEHTVMSVVLCVCVSRMGRWERVQREEEEDREGRLGCQEESQER